MGQAEAPGNGIFFQAQMLDMAVGNQGNCLGQGAAGAYCKTAVPMKAQAEVMEQVVCQDAAGGRQAYA